MSLYKVVCGVIDIIDVVNLSSNKQLQYQLKNSIQVNHNLYVATQISQAFERCLKRMTF
ncbi:hypothetical protein RO3G_00660 [Rhizopus delemar RA 99-880]|uniref:Uncharacterized protein n=1 Tax=Rhizopus delemar (strain RA 99-880 / ATCC MYA-4621 / FGSC 9543 / NRRL 43880) TaxID=246409 RepID=I1BIC6_RHIO9|nr:hypothetical protein RO3G_00660 [Rhizopus delemar RA 99-880]|eukprot:EIE75956.1 hypothetical protein RO3G_00660 [Rhizopus delemar RA 99-880]